MTQRRDEIRSAAEREAREIVEAARRDVQRTLVTARQSLLVLATQVQAAVEASAAAAMPRTGIPDAFSLDLLDIEAPPDVFPDLLNDAHQGVHEIFELSRPELEALLTAARDLGGDTADGLASDGSGDPFGFPSEHSNPFEPVATPARTPARPPAPAQSAPAPPAPVRSAPAGPPSAPPPSARPASARSPAPATASPAPPAPAPPVAPPTFHGVGPAYDVSPGADPECDLSPGVGPACDPSPGADPGTPRHPGPTLLWGAAMPVRRASLLAWARRRPRVAAAAAALLAVLLLAAWWSLGPSPLFADRGGDGSSGSPGDVPLPGASDASGAALSAGGAGSTRPALRLEARREVWVQITVNGREDAGRTLRPGERHDITATGEVEIRAGDAGALWVSIDGGEAQPLGGNGRVLTRRFSLTRRESGSAPATSPATGSVRTAAVPTAAGPAESGGRAPQPRTPPPAGRQIAPTSAPPEAQLVTAGERWFESYYRRLPFEAFGTAHQPTVADGRPAEARLPEGIWDVRRMFDQVQVQVVADTAIYSARMTEDGAVGAGRMRHDALVSQVWVRRGSGWQLMDVRLLSPPGGR